MLLLLVVVPTHGISLVFIHIGNTLPDYLYDALEQARLFNEQCPIYVLANQVAIDAAHWEHSKVHVIGLETLKKSHYHEEFCKKSLLDRKARDGFWFYASERFLYLDDFMQQYDLRGIVHLENDTMLYVSLDELEPIFKKHYPGIAAVFDNDQRCIPCFIFIAHKEVMHKLAAFFSVCSDQNKNDMEILALFKKHCSQDIDNLPIIMPTYCKQYVLKNSYGHVPKNPADYAKHFELFNAIFDAAALGQYLGGIDPRNGLSKSGFINESCIFNPSYLCYEWQHDELGRKIPYACLGDKKCRINNLHIHAKNLKQFASKR